MIVKYIFYACAIAAVNSNAISEQKVIRQFESHKKNEQDHHHGSLHHIGPHEPVHHEEYAASFPSYEYSYKVEDPHTGDYKSHHESRHGDVVKGVYSLLQPDGKIRTVNYYADDHTGFKATVRYSSPHHPDQIESYPPYDAHKQSNKEKQPLYFNHMHKDVEQRDENKKKGGNAGHKQTKKDDLPSPFIIYQYGFNDHQDVNADNPRHDLNIHINNDEKINEVFSERQNDERKSKKRNEEKRGSDRDHKISNEYNTRQNKPESESDHDDHPTDKPNTVSFEHKIEHVDKKKHHTDLPVKNDKHEEEDHNNNHVRGEIAPKYKNTDKPYRIKDFEVGKVGKTVEYYGPGRGRYHYDKPNENFELPRLLEYRKRNIREQYSHRGSQESYNDRS